MSPSWIGTWRRSCLARRNSDQTMEIAEVTQPKKIMGMIAKAMKIAHISLGIRSVNQSQVIQPNEEVMTASTRLARTGSSIGEGAGGVARGGAACGGPVFGNTAAAIGGAPARRLNPQLAQIAALGCNKTLQLGQFVMVLCPRR